MDFIRLIRFPNLIIVALTQYLIQYLLHIPFFQKAGLAPVLDHLHFFLLVFVTVVIAAGGYMINDLFDYEIDKINKPEKLIINTRISSKLVWWAYYGINLLGLLLALYLAAHVGELLLSLIFPFAVFLLWCYSKILKKQVLSGNLVVSLFCAFVPGIVVFAERKSYLQLGSVAPEFARELWLLVGGYLFFAFCSTLFREIIKDIEDIEGDTALGINTLPIAWGVKRSKILAAIIGIILLAVLLPWVLLGLQKIYYWDLAYIIFGIAIPVIMVIYKLYQAQTKKQFHQLSQFSKVIMVSGLVYLLIWYL